MGGRAVAISGTDSFTAAMKNDYIITGVPRGGTTLLGCLINSSENAYCFSEPSFVVDALKEAATQEEFLASIRRIFTEQRERILLTGKAVNRISREGCPVTNYFKRSGGTRAQTDHMETEDTIAVSDDKFTLAIKQNAEFLSILPLLCEAGDFQILAILRHPVSTILSWRSLDLPITNGRLPIGEKFWPLLAEIGQTDKDVMLKQVMIYEAIASRVSLFRKDLHLLCYESLVRNPEQLSALIKRRFKNSLKLESRNNSKEYDWNEAAKIKSLINAHAPATLKFYPDLDNFESSIKMF